MPTDKRLRPHENHRTLPSIPEPPQHSEGEGYKEEGRYVNAQARFNQPAACARPRVLFARFPATKVSVVREALN
jgi:hypothetical protein